MAKPPTRSKYPPGTRIRVLRPVSAKMVKGVLVEQHQSVYRGPERSGGDPVDTGGKKLRIRKNHGLRRLEPRDLKLFSQDTLDSANLIRGNIERAIKYIRKETGASRNKAIAQYMTGHEPMVYGPGREILGLLIIYKKVRNVHYKIVYNPFQRTLLWSSTRRIYVPGETVRRDRESDSKPGRN